jgi:tetratricopeptide (TPR) repeat protein
MNNLQAAFLYQQMQRYDLAIQAANRVLDQVPSSTAYVARAASEALIGDKKHSIQDLDQAIAREPNNSNLYELRAIEYDDDGRYKEELADLDVAVKLDPSNAEFQAQIAGALFSLGRKQEGYKHLQMALSLQPTYVEAYFQLGTQKLYDKSYLDAFQDFTTEINLIRGNTPPFGYPLVNILGRCPPQNITMRRDHEASSLVLRSSAAMGSRHYSSAECDLEEALQLDPSDAGNHAMRSILAERENDYQRALTEIDKAIGFDSSEKQYRSSRERILRELKMKK